MVKYKILLPNSFSLQTFDTKPILKPSSAVTGKPVNNINAAAFLFTQRLKAIPGVEQNMPKFALK